ncbi:aromatic amino acid transport family protein [Serratia odorifera]|jgi:amino acid permease|uniref:Transmembrane amino acid transporter protein n=2 Tax=Serratia odorifera TaxID=618 RepID=D4E1E3_SEROD|nr:amino acid permease [Serratia odorifera]EFE96488.1 transmembrane amino acid transporter protein [Serratia odorifera DSM 4582]MBJ2068001.1 amino acid permease [Serratia odorifera]PNK91022.1 amino acid permease [Serratia odorifera]RII72157.1 amino acid permease [Serratia odorifera]VDZ57254.1 Tyrosine permease [Serratia odorifera]
MPSDNITLSPALAGERASAPAKSLSFLEGVAMIVGTNIGAGVLSIAYASSKAGFLPLLFWLVLVGCLTTITMLYVAESTLRTRAHLQLSGLAKRYVGGLGAWLMFASVCVNSVGALTAYMTGSGKLLQSLFGISPAFGSLLFFIPAAGVLYLGLKAIGRGEKFISIGMVVMLSVLVMATLLKDTTQMRNLLDGDWRFMVPVFNVVVFCFSAQYIVPEMARGFSNKPEQLPKAIIVGMVITFVLLAAVPLSVIALSGLDGISDVATISWGQALGQWAFFSANIFALCAMLTSYWGLGGSFLTNIFDKFRLGDDEQPLRRFGVLLLVVVPPFVLAYSGFVSFVNALYFAGVFSGVILSIMPMLILRGARKNGDMTPRWQCNWITHPLLQISIVLLYLSSAVYAIASLLGFLPAGW